MKKGVNRLLGSRPREGDQSSTFRRVPRGVSRDHARRLRPAQANEVRKARRGVGDLNWRHQLRAPQQYHAFGFGADSEARELLIRERLRVARGQDLTTFSGRSVGRWTLNVDVEC